MGRSGPGARIPSSRRSFFPHTSHLSPSAVTPAGIAVVRAADPSPARGYPTQATEANVSVFTVATYLGSSTRKVLLADGAPVSLGSSVA